MIKVFRKQELLNFCPFMNPESEKQKMFRICFFVKHLFIKADTIHADVEDYVSQLEKHLGESMNLEVPIFF